MKRISLTFLAFVIAAGATFAAGGREASTDTAESKAAQKIRYVIPGDQPKDFDAAIKAINRKLVVDIGSEVDFTYIPWDAWEQKINLMLSTGEEFDLFHVMQDWIPYSTYFAKGGLADISDAVEQYGPSLKKAIPDDIWDGAKIKGRTYVIPTFWVELASEGDFTIRKDLLKANGLSEPKNPEELLKAAEIVAKNWKGKDKLIFPMAPSTNYADPIGMHSSVLHRAYSSFPFTVKEKLFYVSQTGEVASWVETPEFKQDAAWFRKAYQKGLIDPDILVLKQDQFSQQNNSGSWVATFGTIGNLLILQKAWPKLADADIETMKFYPEKPNLRPWGIKNCNAVPVTSDDPSKGVKLLNWLYSNQENYDLFMYGIEGTHFTKVGDRKRESKFDETGSVMLYGQADWMMGNLNFIRLDATMPSATIHDLYTIDPDAINSVAANFFFDASNVRAELANVMNEFAANMMPIYIGVVDFDSNYPQALAKMKQAGLDKVVAEYRSQLKAFMAARQ